jgi:hypothetical protein
MFMITQFVYLVAVLSTALVTGLPTDAGFLYSTAVVIGAAIKETFCSLHID